MCNSSTTGDTGAGQYVFLLCLMRGGGRMGTHANINCQCTRVKGSHEHVRANNYT